MYGRLRASCAERGVTLSALDMMIAAQAVAAGAVLVTRDKAFSHVRGRVGRREVDLSFNLPIWADFVAALF